MAFDLEKALNDYKCPSYFKNGLIYHIKVNELKPKNMKEFNKIIDDYKNITIGE